MQQTKASDQPEGDRDQTTQAAVLDEPEPGQDHGGDEEYKWHTGAAAPPRPTATPSSSST